MEYLYGGAFMPGEGLGDLTCDDTGNCVDSGTASTDPNLDSAGNPYVLPANPNNSPAALQQLSDAYSSMTGKPTTITANPQTGALNITSSLAQDINALMAGGNQIARTVTGQTTTTSAISSNTLLLIGGATIGVIVLVALLGKK